MRAILILPLLLGAATARAEPPLTPDGFESLATGHTVYFALEGLPFGAEQYFPGRRVLWRFADGRCHPGRWYAEGDLICFAYDDPDEPGGPSCWRFHARPTGFAAELIENDLTTGFVLDSINLDQTPLDCPGPDVGS